MPSLFYNNGSSWLSVSRVFVFDKNLNPIPCGFDVSLSPMCSDFFYPLISDSFSSSVNCLYGDLFECSSLDDLSFFDVSDFSSPIFGLIDFVSGASFHDSFTISNDTPVGWSIRSVNGSPCFCSGVLPGHSVSSASSVSFSAPEDCFVTVVYYSSSEGPDRGSIFLDGVLVPGVLVNSGTTNPVEGSSVTFFVPKGVHSIKFSYSKDSSVSQGLDLFCVRSINIFEAAPVSFPLGFFDFNSSDSFPPVSSFSANTSDAQWDFRVLGGLRRFSSGVIADSKTSSSSLSFFVSFPTLFEFSTTISSELSCDKGTIALDGVAIAGANALTGSSSRLASVLVSPGLHVFKFTYSKDGSIARDFDAFCINSIRVTPVLSASESIGFDDSIYPSKQISDVSVLEDLSVSVGYLAFYDPDAPAFHFDPAQLGDTGSAVSSIQCGITGLQLPSVGTVTVGATLGQKSLAIESGAYLATSALPFVFPTGEFTMFAVMRVRSVALYDGVLCVAADNEQDFSTANGFTLEKSDSTNALRCTHRAGNSFERTISYPFNVWSVFTWHRSYALGSHDVYVRMTKIHSDAFSGNAAINPSRFAINARVNSGNTFGAAASALDLADLIIYNNALSLPSVVEIQNTLCNKYGI